MSTDAFAVGAVVVIGGLKRPEYAPLNGQAGLVVGYKDDPRLVVVRVQGASVEGKPPAFAMREENLTVFEGSLEETNEMRQKVLWGRVREGGGGDWGVAGMAEFQEGRDCAYDPLKLPGAAGSTTRRVWYALVFFNIVMLAWTMDHLGGRRGGAGGDTSGMARLFGTSDANRAGEQHEGEDFRFYDATTRETYHAAAAYADHVRALEHDLLELGDGVRSANPRDLGFVSLKPQHLDEAVAKAGFKWFPTTSCSPYGAASVKNGVPWDEKIPAAVAGICACSDRVFFGKACGNGRVDMLFRCKDVCMAGRDAGSGGDIAITSVVDSDSSTAFTAYPNPLLRELEARYSGTSIARRRAAADGGGARADVVDESGSGSGSGVATSLDGSDDGAGEAAKREDAGGSGGDASPTKAAGAESVIDETPTYVSGVITGGLAPWMDRGLYAQRVGEFEKQFNGKYKFPYVFFTPPAGAGYPADDAASDVGSGAYRSAIADPLDDKKFMIALRDATQVALRGEGSMQIERIQNHSWALPTFRISNAVVKEELYKMDLNAFRLNRFFILYFQNHPALQKYEYFWLFDYQVSYPCSIPYNPFLLMEDQGKSIGFNAMQQLPTAHSNSFALFIRRLFVKLMHSSDKSLISLFTTEGGNYNRCSFDDTLLIGKMAFFRSRLYSQVILLLDSKSWMFVNWPMTAALTLVAALGLSQDELYYFESIGSVRNTRGHLPVERETCTTPRLSDNDDEQRALLDALFSADGCLVPHAHLASLTSRAP